MCAHPSRGGAAYNTQIISRVHLTQALHTAQNGIMCTFRVVLAVHMYADPHYADPHYLRGGPASAQEDHRRQELELLLAWQEERGDPGDGCSKGGACAGRGHLDGPGHASVRGTCVRRHVVVVVLRACLLNASPRAGHSQRRRARVPGPVIPKGGSGTRSYSNLECAG